MSFERKSTPPTSRPIARTARSAMSRLSGWITSVTSVAVPPVERFAVERRKTTRPPRLGDGIGVQIHVLEHLLGLSIEFKTRQDLFMTHAAARVLVHELDQL